MNILLSSLIALTVTLWDIRGESAVRLPSYIAKIEVSDHYVNSYGLRDKVDVIIKGLFNIAFPGKSASDFRVEITQ